MKLGFDNNGDEYTPDLIKKISAKLDTFSRLDLLASMLVSGGLALLCLYYAIDYAMLALSMNDYWFFLFTSKLSG